MQQVPNYVLYGENESESFTDLLHIESIKARSLYHDWKFRSHMHHNLHQFFYIESGGGKALIENLEHSINNKMLIGIPPLSVHGFTFHPNTKGWVLTIPDAFLQDILKENILFFENLNQVIIFQCKQQLASNEIEDILSAINNEYGTIDPTYIITLRSLISLLIAKVIKYNPLFVNQSVNTSSKKHILLRSFQNSLNKNFKDRLSVADYASEINITPTHLNRICRSILSVSTSELIDERTLLEAKRLLIYTSVSITEISQVLGFCDPGHFSKFFIRKTQQKASDFRKIYTQVH